jgi:hypothetical protein
LNPKSAKVISSLLEIKFTADLKAIRLSKHLYLAALAFLPTDLMI